MSLSIGLRLRKVVHKLRSELLRAFGRHANSAKWQEDLAEETGQAPREDLAVDDMNDLAVLFREQRYAELEGRASALLGQFPSSGFAWQALGVSHQMQGKNAVPALRRAAELLPDDAQVQNNLGEVLKGARQFDEAAASYGRALTIQPDLAEAHRSLGSVLRALGRLDEAASSYRRAIELAPNFPATHIGLGNALRDMGKSYDAETCFRRALEIDPSSADALIDLGLVLNDLGRVDEADASYLKALEITSGEVSSVSQRISLVYAAFLKERGLTKESAYHYQKAFSEVVC